MDKLNIYSFIGVLLLMGIVKKNSILLVEFANGVRDKSQVNAFDTKRNSKPSETFNLSSTHLPNL